ncbi:uncharacterized protein LOC124941118 [Impatiens glandulifera]|uniref:uncharacterized protein LOC124941118 n=1 Tax=Impatiens glandulifera TaxID=253017 RepID=UPI001FB16361|nr:uncharacterized protein LOC124941118 [Impatiens glandulifera]
MATGVASISISGATYRKSSDLCFPETRFLGQASEVSIKRKCSQKLATKKLFVCSQYDDSRGGGGGGGDFAAGFLLGGAIFGTLGYIFAPQIRKAILNEDEYGFRRAKRPIYYDGGLEKTRQTLNEKISQLNSAIDNVSSRLRGGNNMPPVPVESDPEEATM